MLLPLKMIDSCRSVGKSTLFAKFGTVLWFCGGFERFWGSLVSKWANLYQKRRFNPFEGIGAPRCIVCRKEQWLGSVSVGLPNRNRD